MEIITVQEQLEKLLLQVDPITEQYQKAKTEYENLDKQEKTILAQIATKKEGSESARQREALADDRYTSYKEAVKMAREEYNRCWALLEGLKLKKDILQSINKHLA